jgi:hypothetical protein
MSGGTGKEREERAVDALLVSALRQQESEGTDVDAKNLPQLTEEEKAAMKALESNFIQRLLAGERPLGATAVPQESDTDECEELAAAGCGADGIMYRAEEVDEETKQELDEQEREILERKARERKERGGSDNP